MSQTLVPTSLIADGGWYGSTDLDVTSLVADTSDASDSTFAAANGGTGTLILRLTAGTTPAAGTRTITIRMKDLSGTEVLGSVAVAIRQGTTLVQSFTQGAGTLTGSAADYTFTVTNAITDYSIVRIYITPAGTWVDTDNLKVIREQFVIPDAPSGKVLQVSSVGGLTEFMGGMQ